MDFQNIQTVKELTHALKQYNQTLATTIFDDTQGYISVAFRKESIERNGKNFQFLCFYPNYKVALYPVETLLSYLEKLQEQALEKMLKELETEHDNTVEYIHNWLCKQNDESLFQGILKEDRTIKGSVTYCMGKAQEQAEKRPNAMVMVTDEVAFSWIKEYFILEKLPEMKAIGKVVTTAKKKPSKKEESKPQRKEVDEQVKLFEL